MVIYLRWAPPTSQKINYPTTESTESTEETGIEFFSLCSLWFKFLEVYAYLLFFMAGFME
jgi:hypothetical protein